MDGYCALIWGLFLVSGFQFVYYDKKILFFLFLEILLFYYSIPIEYEQQRSNRLQLYLLLLLSHY